MSHEEGLKEEGELQFILVPKRGDSDARPKAAPQTVLAEGEGVAMVCVRLLFGTDDNKVITSTGVTFSPAGCPTSLPKSRLKGVAR